MSLIKFPKNNSFRYELILASLFIHLLALTIPISISLFFDLVIPNQSLMTAITLMLGVIISVIFDGLLRGSRVSLAEKLSRKVDIDSECKAQKIIKENYRYLSTKSDLKKALDDIKKNMAQVSALSRSSFIIPALDTIASCIYLLAIFLIGGFMVIIPVIFMLIIIVSAWVIMTFNNSTEQLAFDALQEKSIRAGQEGNAIDQVLLNGWITSSNDAVNEIKRYHTSQSKSRSLGQSFSAIVNACAQLQTISILLFGFFAITNQSITAGSLFATLMLSGRLVGALGNSYNVLNQLSKYFRALGELNNLERNINCIKSEYSQRPLQKLSESIVFKHVDVNFDNKPALVDINLSIKVGEKTALLGSSASGKSTLLKLIAGLVIPSSGHIFYDGVMHNQIEPTSYLKYMNLVMQYPFLFDGTIVSNLKIANNDLDDDEIIDFLSQFKFCDFITKNGFGLKQKIESSGANLSPGHRQIISLMRCIICEPKLIIMDEPLQALQQDQRNELIEWIKHYPHGMIIATDDKKLIHSMDRILNLTNGRLIEDRQISRKSSTQPVRVCRA